MKLLKAFRFIVLLLLAGYIFCLNKDYTPSFNSFFKELTVRQRSHSHAREKRAAGDCFPENCSKINVDIFLSMDTPNNAEAIEFINVLRGAVENVILPLHIIDELVLGSVNLTTACYPNSTGGHQCHCEDQLLWSSDICDTYGACSNASTQNCDCINGIPNGQFCEPSIITLPTPLMTASVITVIKIRTLKTEPTNLIQQLREAVDIVLQFNATTDLIVTSLNLTTVCYTNFNGQQQCQCEDQFLWSCEICETYGACNNDSIGNCDCINGIPPDGQFCETNVTAACLPPSTESAPTGPPTLEARSLSFTMNIDFDESYNDENNDVYQICLLSIETQSRIHILGLQSADLLGFSAGSTIADFEITANTSIQDAAVDALLMAIFSDLRNTFPVVFDNNVTVTCGPPPVELDLRITSTEWRRDGVLINEDDRHSFSQANGAETLLITNYFFTDNGRYQCQLFDEESSFRQDSNGRFNRLETPTIQTVPLQNTILCEVGQQVSLQCSVQDPYQLEFRGISNSETGPAIQHQVTITQADCDNQGLNIICQVIDLPLFRRELRLVLVLDGAFTCVADPEFGNGFLNDVGRASCEINEVGEKTAICRVSGEWEDREDNCTLQRIVELLGQSRFLDEITLPEFLEELSNVTLELSQQVTESPNNIDAIVTIINNVATFVTTSTIQISQVSMEDVLLTTDVLTRDEARESWDILNLEALIETIETRNTIPRNESVSSLLLFGLEGITSRLINASLNIETPLILLNKTTFTNSFNGDFNSTVEIDIEESSGPTNLTVITFESLDNVLPPRDENNATGRVINGRVVLVQSDTTVDNVSFTFDIIDETLGNPQCVFWNFTLFEGLGGWDDEGCELVVRDDETVTCQCDHLTSFSILMSPFVPNRRVLDFITYIGVGISMASLVICLIIEALIWKEVRKKDKAHLSHIPIVNIALSLLIANIWFIIGASISEGDKKNPDACTAATFFIHFFYLVLFFWMLASALLLFYLTVFIFGNISKTTLIAIGFSLGYGAPLIITVITIAVTEPNNAYIQETVICWLNWDKSRALLAFVIPALLIVLINIVIIIVALVTILHSKGMSITVQNNDNYIVVEIARTLAILTPFFGITWSLGVGTLTDPTNLGIHIAFAFFNSLQGFFILVFGTLLSRQVRSLILGLKPSQNSGSGTATTSFGTSSSGGLFGKRNNRKNGGNNSSSDATASSQVASS
ncbi:adhesion G-protein coupled receptor F1-like isoform X2 [Phyllopteryx taeniolatus]|uniref:adhesion G-protein coupled receptor F1-like isoform X2 n=1 Tax=Phyllopteryx taeniolatus TaxID=161469 RepID=UPI002AD5024D|nr:adhesion G-protein coupled receptor F1-like isoform X2 [Phyllopteryx taeniolatus]